MAETRTARERIMDVLADWVGSDETLGAGADAVLAALAEGTDSPATDAEPTELRLIEYETPDGRWTRYMDHVRHSQTWYRSEAEAEARAFAEDGYRVRIVPLLRGEPIEIQGGE